MRRSPGVRRVSSLFAALCGFVVVVGGAVPAVASPVPVEDFFRHPMVSDVQLSPDGKTVAMLAPSTAKDDRVVLAVASVETPSKLTVVAHFDYNDIRSFHWVNDKRIAFDLVDWQSEAGNQRGGGLFAVNIDSTEFVHVVARTWGDDSLIPFNKRPLPSDYQFYDVVGDGSDDVFALRYNRRSDASETITTSMVRINTKNHGVKQLVRDISPEGARNWVLDQGGERQVRLVETVVGNEARLLSRKTPESPFATIATTSVFGEAGKGYFTPLALDPQGQLYGVFRLDNAERTSALFKVDVASGKAADEPLLSLKGFDFDGQLVMDRSARKLLGIRYTTDAQGTAWLDPTMKALQDEVDQKLPSTNNVLITKIDRWSAPMSHVIVCNKCGQSRRVLVVAYSDRLSPVYFVYDREAKTLGLVGASRPWIDDKKSAERDFVRFEGRDGMAVPVHVTRPKGKGPWPTVVLVHGGPYVRGGEWAWDRDSQFLASRGYLVVEPEFRGSTGYGDRLYRAGWKQWGLAMQDDITDATRWAIKQGLADPKRIAIAGASYGGYAAMMGLIKEPDLYRAGINWVGVTDIELMYDIDWSDFAGDDWQRYGMPALVGDRDKDRQQLVATSPIQQAGRISKPVFMAYGSEDLRVPMPHGTKMRDALKKAGKVEVEWVVYQDEGHGWLLVKNNVDFWTRVEKFLAKHLQ